MLSKINLLLGGGGGRYASYAPLDDSQATPPAEDDRRKARDATETVKSISYRHALLLYASNVILAALLLALFLIGTYSSKSAGIGSYERGFPTEIRPDEKTLALRKVKFYGGIMIDENGTYSLSQAPGEPDYFGPAGRETDHAWGKILKDRFIGVLPNDWPPEAVKLDYDDDLVKGKFWLETSGLHALHCLDYIRKSFSPEYYYKNKDQPGQSTTEPKSLSHSMHLRRKSPKQR